MTTDRLPVEVYENIIDFCRPTGIQLHANGLAEPVTKASSATLSACCRTRKSWLSRSRYRLYSVVVLQNFDDASIFLATITQHPSLAAFTHTICIAGSSYTPYARPELVEALPNLRTLHLSEIPWRQYPHRYCLDIAKYSITELHVCMVEQELGDLLRVVWSLRNLQSLRLMSTGARSQTLSVEEARQIQTLAERHRHCCAALRRLELTVCRPRSVYASTLR